MSAPRLPLIPLVYVREKCDEFVQGLIDAADARYKDLFLVLPERRNQWTAGLLVNVTILAADRKVDVYALFKIILNSKFAYVRSDEIPPDVLGAVDIPVVVRKQFSLFVLRPPPPTPPPTRPPPPRRSPSLWDTALRSGTEQQTVQWQILPSHIGAIPQRPPKQSE
jgi:hypothetical protein